MEKILLDTDIGTDIDDAITMSYLLKQKRCELLGITVTGGETEKRAALASVMCRAAGRPDLPIYPGPDRPLLVRQKECFAPEAKILRDWEHQESFPRGEAIAFMRRTIRANPGEVTLLAIAPLTNIALLFASDPEIPSLLKRLVLMGGRFSNFASVLTDNIDKAFVPEHTDPIICNGALEMNALIDPHATAIVYQTHPPIHRSVGVDMTHLVTMPMEEFRERFADPLHRPILDMSKHWIAERTEVTFHDPLAALSIFNDEICSFERGEISVELTSEKLQGYTYWKKTPEGPHEWAVTVDCQKFFDEYFSVFH